MKRKSWPSLEEWVESESELNRKITELYKSELSPEAQARELLPYLEATYKLPLTPMEVEDREWQDAGDSWYPPISIFEQVAQLKFVEPENNDPRYLVLNAAYLIHHKLIINLAPEMDEYLGNDELQGLGYRGDDVFEAELVPVKKGESWLDKGCSFFSKEGT